MPRTVGNADVDAVGPTKCEHDAFSPADDVADVALSLILATTRNIVNADHYVRSGHWADTPMAYGSGLAGRTLGIVGLGRIGEAVAERALPFKLKIAYHNRTRKISKYTYFPSLLDLAKASDILVCVLPGGEKTRNLITVSYTHLTLPTTPYV